MQQPEKQPDGPGPRTVTWHSPSAEALGVVLGRYRILARIGSGGMGTVFRAQHVHLKQTVAIKTIQLDRQSGQDAVLKDRFRREMEAVGAIQHPHVVRATDGGEEGGVYFLVMEYVDGIDLEQLARRLGPLPVSEACELIRQAALGLSCIHARGWVHRDIKPSNLLLSREGVVKIADLGLARAWTHLEQSTDLTAEGHALGTPDYMAPEQASNAHAADVRSDIYSLGCTLFRLLTGQPPYPPPRFSSLAQKLLAHLQEPVPQVQEVLAARGLPVDPVVLGPVEAVLQRMLAKDPADRFAHPDGVVEALPPCAAGADPAALWRRLQGGDQPGPTDETPGGGRIVTPDHVRPDRTPRPRRFRGKVAVGVLAVLAAGMIGLGAHLGWFGSSQTPTDEPPSPIGPEENPIGPPREEVLPLRWYNLLERPPLVISWPRGDGASQWQHDRDLQQLSVQGPLLGLLELGQIQAPNYVVSAGLLQNRWRGGIGLYLGYRPPDAAGKGGRLQFLQFREEKRRAGPRGLNLTRGYIDLTRGKDGALGGALIAVASNPLKDVVGEQTLEIRVGKGTLHQVRVNGIDARGLLGTTANQPFTPLDHQGGFGVLAVGSDGVYRNARFMLLKGPP